MGLLSKSSAITDGVRIRITEITGEYLGINYHTLSGNVPNVKGNYSAIWQNSTFMIPWGVEPKWATQVNGSDPEGTYTMDDLSLTNKSYVVGFSVVPQAAGVCNFSAAAFIPENVDIKDLENEDLYFDPSICATSVQSDSIHIAYQMMPGYNPEQNNNWLAVWQGMPDMYHKAPDKCVKVNYSTETGGLSIKTDIKRGTRYTVGYFGAGWSDDQSRRKQDALVCMTSFVAS